MRLHFNSDPFIDYFEDVYDESCFSLIDRAFVVDSRTISPELPNGNDFVTRTRYCFWPTGSEKCHLKITATVEFITPLSAAGKKKTFCISFDQVMCVSENGRIFWCSYSRFFIESIEKTIQQNLNDYIQALSAYLRAKLGRIASTTEVMDDSSTTMNIPRTNQTSSMGPSMSVYQVLKVLFVGNTSLIANERDLVYLLIMLILALGISLKLFSELRNLNKIPDFYQPIES